MDVQWRTLPGPDPDRVDWVFRDGDHQYQVSALPAGFPLFGTQGNQSASGLFEILYVLFGSMLADWVDPSWKVVVSRMRVKKPSWWWVAAIEYLETAEAAEARQAAIVEQWVAGQCSMTPRVRRREIARLRRDHRRAIAGSLAEFRRRERKRAGRLAILAGIAAACAGLILLDGLTWDAWSVILPAGLFAVAARGALRAWRDSREADRDSAGQGSR
jgi:hypothetical protein